MIGNVGTNGSSNIMNDMTMGDNTAVERQQQTKEQTRVEELKQLVQNDQYKIDLRATATRMAQELKPQM